MFFLIFYLFRVCQERPNAVTSVKAFIFAMKSLTIFGIRFLKDLFDQGKNF